MKLSVLLRILFAAATGLSFSVSAAAQDINWHSQVTQISRVPVDKSWRKAMSSMDSPLKENIMGNILHDIRDYDDMERLRRINQRVNSDLIFADDIDFLGVSDRWNSPEETLASEIGDCEDFAILKMRLLHAAGFSLDDMYILILEDDKNRHHAALMVEIGGQLRLLDNRTNETRLSTVTMRRARYALGVRRQFIFSRAVPGQHLASASR